jgi:hypothetical protein
MRWQHRHVCSDRQPPAFVAADYRYFALAAAIFLPKPRNVRFRIADFPQFSSLCGPVLPRPGRTGSGQLTEIHRTLPAGAHYAVSTAALDPLPEVDLPRFGQTGCNIVSIHPD